MPKWPRISGKQMIALLRREGYLLVRIRGSHHHFRGPEHQTVTVPLHGNDPLAIGTLRFTVTKMMQLTLKEFLAILKKR